MDNLLQRIKQIAENECISITNLEAKIGASKGVISRALAKGTDIQNKWVSKIVENYPRYDSEWLLTGKGKMIKSQELITNYISEREIIELQREVILLQKEVAILKENRNEIRKYTPSGTIPSELNEPKDV